jgi:hypothetical protein
MLLNALFVPPDRPQNCGLTINASLIVRKRVVNDSGGALGVGAFNVTTNAGALAFNTSLDEGGGSTLYTADAITVLADQAYSLSESNVAGYDEGTWSCTSDFNDNTGGGSFNNGSVTLQPGDIKTCTITNDDALPNINLAKTVSSGPVLEDGSGSFAAGTYTVVYTITATNNGQGSGNYDLNDTFGLPAGVTVNGTPVAAYAGGESQTNSIGVWPNIVTAEPLGAGATESWTVTANFTVDPTTLPPANRNCTFVDPGAGSGFYNAVATILNENPNDNDACVNIPAPNINLAKTVTSGPVLEDGNGSYAAGTYTVVYTIAASNSGQGPGIYDLDDVFGVPAGVTITPNPIAAYAGGETQTKSIGTWPNIVDDEPLAAGATESWTVTANFSVNPVTLDPGNVLCVDNTSGRGFYNTVTAIPGENPNDNDACVNIPAPAINLAKTVSSGPVLEDGSGSFAAGTFTVVYTITATNAGGGPGTYNLDDTFGLPVGVSINGTPMAAYVSGTLGETRTGTLQTWPAIVDDEPLVAGAVETWTVTANFTVDPGTLVPANRICDDFGAPGEGFLNTVATIPGEDPDDNYACADIPPPSINLEKTAGVATPLGGNVFRVIYTVQATNSGDGPGIYDINDVFDDLPAGVSVTNGPIVAYAGGETQTKSVGASPLFVDDEPLAGGNASESWTLTVDFTVDPSTLPAEDRACDAQQGPGNGFYNMVDAIPNEDPNDNDACVDIPTPSINLAKSAGAVTPLGGNVFQVVYTVTATNSTAGPGLYDLNDTFNGLPTGVTVTNGPIVAYIGGETQTQSVGTSPLFVDDEPLGGNSSESWSLTVQFTVDPATLPDGDRACDAQAGPGNGFYNRVATIPGEDPDDNDACVNIPTPSINLAKSAGAATPLGGNVFQVIYTVTATNSGTGPGIYDLSDTFNGLPTGVTVTDGPTVVYAGGETQTKSVGASPLFVDDEPLAGGNASESWNITVQFTVDPQTLSEDDRACDAQQGPGNGFYNVVATIPGEDPNDNDACVNIPGPGINLTKSAGVATPLGGNVFQVIYTITAANNAEGPGTYDLNDTLNQLPTGVTVSSGPVVAYAGGETQTQSVGASPLFVDDEPLGGNASESWTLTVEFTVDPDTLPAEDRACDAQQGPGNGFYNRVDTIPNEDPDDNDACVDIPLPSINLAKSAGAVTPLGGNVFQVVYTITASNSTAGPGTYDLNDTFDGLPTGVTVTTGPIVAYVGGETQTKSVGASPLFVDDEPLGGNATESWSVTVQFTVDPATLPNDDRACDEQTGPGKGFYNRVASIPGEDPDDNDACVNIPTPSINLAKSAGAVSSQGGNVFRVIYTVTATNSGTGPGIYDLNDTFNGLPAGVTVTGGPTVAYAGGETQTRTVGGSPLFVDDEPLGGNASESWTLTVDFTVNPATLPDEDRACDAQAGPGNGFYNRVATIPGENPDDNDACVNIPTAELDLSKVISGAPQDLGNNQWQVTYLITAVNSGTGPVVYDVMDNLQPGNGITPTLPPQVTYIPISDTSNPVSKPLGWPLIADDETLAAGTSESWQVVVQFTLDPNADGFEETLLCEEAQGDFRPGRGFYNAVAVVDGENDTTNNDACDSPRVIKLQATAQCINNAPWVNYSISHQGFPQAPTEMTYTWISRDGNVDTIVAGPTGPVSLSGDLLWPESDVDPGGNATKEPGDEGISWPGWTESPPGVWTFDNDTILVPNLVLRVQVNPQDEVELTYPPGEFPCAPGAVMTIEKSITNVVDNDDGTFDVSYRVQVNNTGGQQGTYDVVDSLSISDALTPTQIVSQVAYQAGTENSNNGPLGTPVIGDFGGIVTLVTGETLEPGLNEAFTFTLRFQLDEETFTPENANCTIEGQETGTGFTNNVELHVDQQLVDEDTACEPVPPPRKGEDRATFTVQKQFMDGNDATEVTFRIDCNTGLILDQVKTTHINPGPLMSAQNYEVEFVVTSFTQGSLTCEVWEDPVVPGYTPTYDCDSNTLATCDSGEESDLDDYFEGPCVFSNVDTTEIGDDEWQHLCMIRNYPDPVPVVINKDWVIENLGGDYIDPWYKLTLTCDNEIITEGAYQNHNGSWSIMFTNNSGTTNAQYSAMVIPDWDGGTSCSVYESQQDPAVEITNGCQNLLAQLADGDECTITNTVFFEGIPTLNQYGVALLALLMLGMGLVGFRRFS